MLPNNHPFRKHPLDANYQHLRLFQAFTILENSGSSQPNSANPQPHVTIVCLDRPHKRNALNAKLWKELGTLFQTFGRDGDDCRAVFLTSMLQSFCSGIDVTDPIFLIGSNRNNNNVAHTGLAFLPKLREMQACFTALEECPLPIVVGIAGPCIGAGIDLICCADIRLCSESAVFSVREVVLGIAADVGTLQRLPKLVSNQSIVRELCLTGRDFSAAEACAVGLVSRVYSTEEVLFREGLKLCHIISQHSPIAVRGTKQALLYARDHTVADGLDQIAMYNSLALQGNDVLNAWTARMNKSGAVFAPFPRHSNL